MTTHRSRVLLARAALFVVAALFLEMVPRLGVGTRLEIIPLSEMLLGSTSLVLDGELSRHMMVSLLSIGSSFLTAVTLGVAVGYGLWRTPSVYAMVSPYLVSYYAIPIFAFYPVLVVMFGANRIPIYLLAAGWAIVAVIVATVEGLAHMRNAWEKVAHMYHLPPWRRAMAVHLPAAWPQIAMGMRLAATYSILGVIASEFILSGEGLGYMVNHHYNSFEFRKMWGGILIVFAVGMGLDVLVRRVARSAGAR